MSKKTFAQLAQDPDPTAQLKADKAELLQALEKCWEVVPLDTYEGKRLFEEIDSLIKKQKP